MRRLSALNSASLLWLLAGCKPAPLPVTQVVVVVGSNAQVDALDVAVRTENGRNLVEERHLDLEPAADTGRTLPTSFTIVAADQERPETARFRVVVVGYHKSGPRTSVPFARAIAVAGFEKDKTTVLPLVLEDGCSDPACGCGFSDPSCSCAPGDEGCGCSLADGDCSQTCVPAAFEQNPSCVAVPDYRHLAAIDPGQELQELASGARVCDAGEALSPDGRCVDLDECAFALDDCARDSLACVNEIGGMYGFRCACPGGAAQCQ